MAKNNRILLNYKTIFVILTILLCLSNVVLFVYTYLYTSICSYNSNERLLSSSFTSCLIRHYYKTNSEQYDHLSNGHLFHIARYNDVCVANNSIVDFDWYTLVNKQINNSSISTVKQLDLAVVMLPKYSSDNIVFSKSE